MMIGCATRTRLFAVEAMDLDMDVDLALLARPRKRIKLQKKSPAADKNRIAKVPALRVGTDCSGWESIVMALKQMAVPIDHRFSCDRDSAAKTTILKNYAPAVYYDDIARRAVSKMERVDLYHAGFPCQPFSQAGKHKGRNDARGRIIDHILEYITEHKPKIVLLENVHGLLTSHFGLLKTILTKLRGSGYTTSYKLMNARNHGVPQNRPRLFIAAVLEPAKTFLWPKSIPTPSLHLFLDPRIASDDCMTLPHQKTARVNVKAMMKKIGAKRSRLASSNIIADIGGSKLHVMDGVSPCLTRSRAGGGGHWLACRGRKMSLEEMARFQGVGIDPPKAPGRAANILRPSQISARQWGHLIGNAIPVNMLVRILSRLLPSAGFSAELGDVWQ